MMKTLFGNGAWAMWVMYGIGVILTCLSTTIALDISNHPNELGLMIVGIAVGPAFLGATLLMHLNYLLELRSKRGTFTHPTRANAPTMSEAVHS